MGVVRTAERVNVVSDSEVLVMFVTADGERPTWKIIRRIHNGIV
jgi:hypothetical protein